LKGNGALCSDQLRNLNIMKNLAQDTTTNANGSSQDARTSPVAALPHGGSEPKVPDAATCMDVHFHGKAKKLSELFP